ncbi:glycosyltransferase [Paenibacillus beijingensis]|uniref:Glycosyltransferase 2-like domain-containing protein n=1 Tax=Paenibacillus beijingensis TaxID=1126833 RepID=A0A0D5NHV6_9BACL|nr:glycosyltransferase [Paenibacillus beijingensis]AJY74508.1 hypothetical protein VN24_07880 [Paenibacillus beijingensis]
MIVKNEEEVLERCLDSVKDIADEIIIIDTGSTDRTKNIAAKYTKHIYDYVWTNDFAAARNEGIRRANSKWVLVMDADEYFNPADALKLRSFLETETPQESVIYAVNVVSFIGSSMEQSMINTGEVPRLFPNHSNLFFTRPIHEQLHSLNGTALTVYLAPVSMYHTGYLKGVVEAKEKSKRNASIFTELKKTTGYSAYDYYTIGNEYGIKDDIPKAIYYYERALKKSEKLTSRSWYPRCVISLIQCYLLQHRFYDAWTLIEQRLSNWRQYPEYNCFKGNIYYYLGLFEEAKLAYEETITAADELAKSTHLFWLDSAEFASTIPLQKLLEISNAENNTEKTIYYLTKLLMQNPYDYKALAQLMELLLLSDPPASVMTFLSRTYNENDVKHLLILFKVSLSLGSEELAAHYYHQLKTNDQELKPADLLDFYLLVGDRKRYESTLQQFEAHMKMSEELLVNRISASLIWNDSDYYNRISIEQNDGLFTTYKTYQQIINRENIDLESIQVSLIVYKLLSRLFQLRQYEIYDQLVNKISNSDIVNSLANFLYKKKQFDLSMNYYSILLQENQLDGTSLENLAFYHFNNGFVSEGLEFLEAAIEKRPHEPYLYVLYLQRCTDRVKKETYRQQFGFNYPQLKKIPAINKFL